ncbi:DUF998 domain-containing protein [Amycolatopsis sp. WQ 127309]|uniref:DUF998 domain-containing protein n=1 Tax=Amycolatopsis sp. WQ 127309 TaxID=2932773 RepID=UPI001FF27197|nr:DUF998 domain-containing protein [Amycolatopsis sp. WQ 127309]UOZ03430.1 DUF998 domain-containing protein [Amycolatopsis sp. WQ 127309]
MITVALGRRADVTALSGVGALFVGAVLILTLGLIPLTNDISVTSQTISQYGLSKGAWLFDLAVLLVAAGSALCFTALRIQNRLPVISATFGALWTIGLLVIVTFPRTNWAVETGSHLGGTLHRIASVVAFVCLPVAVLTGARAAFPRPVRRAFIVRLLGAVSLGWFAVIIGAIVVAAVNGERWWEIIPLGLVERGMALTEIVALVILAAPLRRAREQFATTTARVIDSR